MKKILDYEELWGAFDEGEIVSLDDLLPETNYEDSTMEQLF